jgi:membrane protease YdiL (CAAX protease family)
MFLFQPRSSTVRLIAVVAASYALAAGFNAWFAADDLPRTIAQRSGGWINPNLLMFVPMTLLVGGLLLVRGRLRPASLGLGLRSLPIGVALLVTLWCLIQLGAALAAAAHGVGLEWHPAWIDPGPGYVLGFLIAMILGTALFEEIVFRGYLLPQVGMRLNGFRSRHVRIGLAILLSSLVFASWHLPTLIIHQALDPSAAAVQLGSLTCAGVLLSLLYLRTGNLYVTMAVHALVNAPTLLVATPVPGSFLAGVLGVALIIAGPRLRGLPLRTALPDIAASDPPTGRPISP